LRREHRYAFLTPTNAAADVQDASPEPGKGDIDMKTFVGVVLASLFSLSLLACGGEKTPADSCDAVLAKMVSLFPEEFRDEMSAELAGMSEEDKKEMCDEMTQDDKDCILKATGPEALAECGMAGER
jgi:small lipoprotein (TIGR04454 family)